MEATSDGGAGMAAAPSRVSDDAHGFFLFISYRLPIDVLRRFERHPDARVAAQARKVAALRDEAAAAVKV